MKQGIAFVIAVCLTSVSFAFVAPNRVTDFADKDFSVRDIVSDLGPVKDVASERLKAVGRGPHDLLDEANPRSPAKRRVQFGAAD